MSADRGRLIVPKKKGFLFEPFRFSGQSVPLAKAPLEADTELVVVERGGLSRAFLAGEMAYHHVAQGELAGIPYLVSF